jgi:hypothetical protein
MGMLVVKKEEERKKERKKEIIGCIRRDDGKSLWKE